MKNYRMDSENKDLNREIPEVEKAFDTIMSEAERRKLKLEWKEKLNNLDTQSNTKKSRRLYFQIAGVAASLLLGVLFFTNFNNNINGTNEYALAMVSDTEVYFDIDINSRGNDNLQNVPADPNKEKIQSAIDNGDFDSALKHYNDLDVKKELSIDDKYVYGVLILKSSDKDYKKAAKLLDEVVKTKNKYYQEALWFDAIAHTLSDNSEKAQLALNKLLKFEYKQEEATLLLDKILTN